MKTRGSLRLVLLRQVHRIRRAATPTWIAASPMPGASYMVSNMSSASARIPASPLTGSETSRNRLSGSLMISRNAIVARFKRCI